MATAKEQDTVKVHYTGTLEDGTTFDSSQGRDPIEFTLGEGQVIPGFEEAVTGMEPGEKKKITIEADEAYGERRPDLVMAVDREQLPENMDPSVGDQLEMSNGEQTFVVMVTDVSDSAVQVDANHPLAGKDLTFELALVEIV